MQVITEGKDLTIAFNVRYITDVLKALSDDQIVMRFNSNGQLSVSGAPGSRVQRISADAGDVAQPEPFQELRTRAHRAGRGRDRVHRPERAGKNKRPGGAAPVLSGQKPPNLPR